MPHHHPAAKPARDHHATPVRRVRRAAVAAWLLVVTAWAALLVLETAGRYYP